MYQTEPFLCRLWKKQWKGAKNTHYKKVNLNFHYIIRYELFKLLCTLVLLWEGAPLRPLRLNFLSHPRSTLLIAIFCRHDTRTKEKACITHISATLSPTCLPLRYCAPPPTFHLSPVKVSSKSALQHFPSPRTTGIIFPFHLSKYFLRALTMFFFLILPWTASNHPTPSRCWRSRLKRKWQRWRRIPPPASVGGIFPRRGSCQEEERSTSAVPILVILEKALQETFQ